jgi:hypothetical protein
MAIRGRDPGPASLMLAARGTIIALGARQKSTLVPSFVNKRM